MTKIETQLRAMSLATAHLQIPDGQFARVIASRLEMTTRRARFDTALTARFGTDSLLPSQRCAYFF
jgi:hypothetical protein